MGGTGGALMGAIRGKSDRDTDADIILSATSPDVSMVVPNRSGRASQQSFSFDSPSRGQCRPGDESCWAGMRKLLGLGRGYKTKRKRRKRKRNKSVTRRKGVKTVKRRRRSNTRNKPITRRKRRRRKINQ